MVATFELFCLSKFTKHFFRGGRARSRRRHGWLVRILISLADCCSFTREVRDADYSKHDQRVESTKSATLNSLTTQPQCPELNRACTALPTSQIQVQSTHCTSFAYSGILACIEDFSVSNNFTNLLLYINRSRDSFSTRCTIRATNQHSY